MKKRILVSVLSGLTAFFAASCDLSPLLSGENAITAFSFITPAAIGTIDDNAGAILITVPGGTDKTKLVAKFATTGTKVEVNHATQKSGVTANNFSNPVVYTVTAKDKTKKRYTVTVQSSGKAISAFSFLTPAATGVINEYTKTITVTVPGGANKTTLVAKFTTTGAKVKIGSVTQTSGVTVNDFSSPVTYTVIAEDGSTAGYTVLVRYGAKAITAFSFVNPSATGSISEGAKTITVPVPGSTNKKVLVAKFTTTGVRVEVGSVIQTSGITVNDFSAPVTYKVTAEDKSTAVYTVTVNFYKRCLFFSAASAPGSTEDTALISKVRSWKYDVTVKAPPALGTWPADSFALFDFAFLSESPNSSDYKMLKGHPLPLLSLEAWAADKPSVLNWGVGSSVSNYEPKVCVITGATGHPLTAGFPKGKEFRLVDSTLVPFEAAIAFKPAIKVLPIAAFKDSLSLVCACAVDRETLLADSVTFAKNRAVTIGIHASAYRFITDEAYRLIQAGIAWILDETESPGMSD